MPPGDDSQGYARYGRDRLPRLVTGHSPLVTVVTARHSALVGDPALCWNSTDRRGIEPARRGRNAAPSGGETRGNQRRSLKTTGGRFQGARHDADTVFLRSRGGAPGPEVATLVQGRFKRDGSASAEPEAHDGTGPGKGSA